MQHVGFLVSLVFIVVVQKNHTTFHRVTCRPKKKEKKTKVSEIEDGNGKEHAIALCSPQTNTHAHTPEQRNGNRRNQSVDPVTPFLPIS